MNSPARRRSIALVVAESLPSGSHEQLARWLQTLLDLRAKSITPRQKLRQLKQIRPSESFQPTLAVLYRFIKRNAWEERRWPSRLAIVGASVTAATVGGQAAGLAAFGTAVAVPLWIVFGAGGAFAGVLIEELRRYAPATIPAYKADNHIVDAEWEFVEGVEEQLPAALRGDSPVGKDEAVPLHRFFLKSFRAALKRQKGRDSNSDCTE
jgi:hypothetical protein